MSVLVRAPVSVQGLAQVLVLVPVQVPVSVLSAEFQKSNFHLL